MTLGQSTSIQDQRVYASDTEPVDNRDGVMWVDTSVSPRDTYVYSTDSASWEKIAAESWKVQNTAPTGPQDGDGWIDTSATPPRARIYEADTGTWEPLSRYDTPAAYTRNWVQTTGLSGNGDVIIETHLGPVEYATELTYTVAADMKNHDGSGSFPGLGFRLLKPMVLEYDAGTVFSGTNTSFTANSHTETVAITVSDGDTLTGVVYDSAGGGGSNDAARNVELEMTIA